MPRIIYAVIEITEGIFVGNYENVSIPADKTYIPNVSYPALSILHFVFNDTNIMSKEDKPNVM